MRGYQFCSNDAFYSKEVVLTLMVFMWMDTQLLMVILVNTFGLMLVVWNNTYNLAFFLIYAPVIKDQ